MGRRDATVGARAERRDVRSKPGARGLSQGERRESECGLAPSFVSRLRRFHADACVRRSARRTFEGSVGAPYGDHVLGDALVALPPAFDRRRCGAPARRRRTASDARWDGQTPRSHRRRPTSRPRHASIRRRRIVTAKELVGPTGFEPAISTPPVLRVNQATLRPDIPEFPR